MAYVKSSGGFVKDVSYNIWSCVWEPLDNNVCYMGFPQFKKY